MLRATRRTRWVAKLLIIGLLSAIPASPTADAVYLSRTGTKYHRQNCRTLKYAPVPISRVEAEKRGYMACKVCKP